MPLGVKPGIACGPDTRQPGFWPYHRGTFSNWVLNFSINMNTQKSNPSFVKEILLTFYAVMMPYWHRDSLFQELLISPIELKEMSEYYFDGKGKAFRPVIVVLMARACNSHYNNSRWVIYFCCSVLLYLAGLPSQDHRLASCLRCTVHLRIHLMMTRFWLGATKSLWNLVWAPSFSTFFMSMEERLQL